MDVVTQAVHEFSGGCSSIWYSVKLTNLPAWHYNRSEWQPLGITPSWKYIAWKSIYCGIILAILIGKLIVQSQPEIWRLKFFFVYLTNWTLLLQTSYCILALGLLIHRKFISGSGYIGPVPETVETALSNLGANGHQQEYREPINHKISETERRILEQPSSKLESVIWLLFTLSSVVTVFVSIAYWVLVYNPKDQYEDNILRAIWAHGINGVLTLIDIFVVALPVRITHGIYIAMYALIYAIFTLIYEYASGGIYEHEGRSYLYNFLDWHSDPKTAIAATFASFLLCLILHLILWSFYFLRLQLVRHLSKRRDKEKVVLFHCKCSSMTELMLQNQRD